MTHIQDTEHMLKLTVPPNTPYIIPYNLNDECKPNEMEIIFPPNAIFKKTNINGMEYHLSWDMDITNNLNFFLENITKLNIMTNQSLNQGGGYKEQFFPQIYKNSNNLQLLKYLV